MNITSNDILDSLMRAALTPQARTATDGQGNVFQTYSPSVMDPIVRAIADQIKNDPQLQAAIVAQVADMVPDLVPLIQKRLVDSVIREDHSSSGMYGRTRMIIADWAKEGVQAALVEALRGKVEAHVTDNMGDLPLDQYDLDITVNLVPKK